MSSSRKFTTLSKAGLSAFVIFIATDSRADDISKDSYFSECPVGNTVRVSNAQSAQRFAALGNCSDRLVQAAVPRVELLPPVARIPGVSEDKEDEAPRGKKKSRAAPSSSSSASPDERVVARRTIRVAPPYDGEIRQVAARYRIDPLFIHAMVAQESAARPQARSHKGALGLMQIMPATGAMLGVAPAGLFDPATNLDAGARYLKKLQKRFGTDFALILSAYNAGEGAVERYGNRIPPFAETQAYVTKVMGRYGTMRLAGGNGLGVPGQ